MMAAIADAEQFLRRPVQELLRSGIGRPARTFSSLAATAALVSQQLQKPGAAKAPGVAIVRRNATWREDHQRPRRAFTCQAAATKVHPTRLVAP
mmetsp:Transcript_15267/g.32977  ORF Transcript_15267/g.32977 Transcript_15267/m.32977 type:complete len:94 (+) Transcript_15267:1121-1402(+)